MRLRTLSLACAGLLLVSGVQALSYTATPFGVSGASSSYLYDINNSGTMLGNATIAGESRMFTSQSGTVSFLSGPAGSVSSIALGLSDGGLVVGAWADRLVDDGIGNLVPVNQGFLYDGSSYTTIALAGYTETVARDVSNNGRYVSGYAVNDSGFSGWLLDRSTGVFDIFTSAALVIAQGVSDDGRVIGSRLQLNPGGPATRSAFWYQAGVLTEFNLDGIADTRARDFNSSGRLTGWLRDSGRTSAFVGTADDYARIDYGTSGFTFAEGINDAGTAVGAYTDANGEWQALVFNPVPLPGSLLLAALSLGLMSGLRRRP